MWIPLVLLENSLGGKFYAYVIANDFSRFTWFMFLSHKKEVFQVFSKFCKKVYNGKSFIIICIKSDYGREFENIDFQTFFNEHEIDYNFFIPETP